ncbi:hypothetical protein RUM44_007144 [Polyplax serrata]|uniref:Uncharacterized protein n=1 Tax=Polyplax serrata TaxID=468196 RepID=A0ABR1B0C3_POLSC
MFNLGSYEKRGVVGATPDSSSPSRSNSSNRFSPVGMSPMGDENQHIRIQLAVHKYNNSMQSPAINRRMGTPCARQPFFSYERNGELAGTSEKRFENRYEGVGNFPTVHLRKSAVRYRPIRKFNEVKVPFPELPVNRFLNHLPELCTDPKSSTRSVFDVLQDMSREKIHSKDDKEYPRYGSRGLGGDVSNDGEAVLRPLFVKKPRTSMVLTRDNTTQTLFPENMEAFNSMSTTTSIQSDSQDPKAKLRRQLAKQNNEIFASLSSSNASFAMKRKIDKISTAKEDRMGNVSINKKAKLQADCHPMRQETLTSEKVNNVVKAGSGNSEFLPKVTRRSKPGDLGNTTSPNKDRLTTIFLDMEGSPKAQMFQNSGKTNGTLCDDSLNKSGTPGNTNSLELKTDSSKGIESSSKTLSPLTSTPQDKSGVNVETNVANSFSNNNNNSASDKFKFESTPKINLNVSSSETKLPTGWNPPATFVSTEFGKQSEDGSNPATKATSTVSVSTSVSMPSISSPFTSRVPEKTEQNTCFKIPTSSSVTQVLTSITNVSQVDGQTKLLSVTTNASTTTFTITTSSAPQITFGNNITCTTSKSMTLPVVSSAVSQSSLTGFTGKVFTTEQNPKTTQATTIPVLPTSLSANPEASKVNFTFGASSTTSSLAATTTTTTTLIFNTSSSTDTTGVTIGNIAGQTAPSSSPFVFGQKPVAETSVEQNKNDAGLDKTSKTQLESSNATTGPFKSVFTNFQAPVSTAATTQGTGQTTTVTQSNLFSFGTTTTTPVTANSVFPTSFGQKSSSMTVSTESSTKNSDATPTSAPPTFTFGQTSIPSSVGQNAQPSATPAAQPKVFSFGQTPTTQASFSTGGGFGSIGSNNPFGPSSSIFGQSTTQVSTNTSMSQVTAFGQTESSTSKPANAFESKTGAVSFGTVSNTSIFGQNTNTFGAKATTFGTPATSAQTGFSIPTTQTEVQFGGSSFAGTGFGGAGTVQSSALTFGAPKTTQATISFGSSTTTGFVSTTSASQSTTFGAPSTTQASKGFTSPFGGQPTFGQFNKSPTSSSIFNKDNQSTTSALTAPTNTLSSNFGTGSGQSIFGAKPNSGQESTFGQQSKLQTTSFGTPGQGGFAQNKFTFGTATSNVTSFTPSPPKTTSAGVFTFGAASNANPASAPAFGAASTSATPFSFTSQNSTATPFKFGASGTGDMSGTPSFSFGAQKTENNPLEAKPAPATAGTFNFGSTQAPPQTTFNFNATPSPSVFSFGSTGSASSGSSFNFGSPQPGGVFGQGTPSPGVFSAPGTFSIGSGSSQSRPRASSRLRRRP